MDARRHQPQGRRSAIHRRLGVDLGASLDQHLRDRDYVLRSLLSEILDAVGTHILQEGRVMLARRAGSNQVRILAKQSLKTCYVAADDGVYRRFELCDGRVLEFQRFQVLRELDPVVEIMMARHDGSSIAAGKVRMTWLLLAKHFFVFAKQP